MSRSGCRAHGEAFKNCRSCNSVRNKAWRDANPEKWKASHERWRKAHPEKARVYQKKHALKRRLAELGITREQRLAVFEESDGLCAICYQVPAIHLDHDHETMEVRGALCGPCNQALGLLRDDPERLRCAADYIDSYRELIIKPKVG